MKNKKITYFLLIILAAAAFWFVINKGKSTINNALRDFAISDTASIDKIVLMDKIHTITIERSENASNWKVNQTHGVNINALKTLLYTINKIDIKTPIGKNEAQGVVQKLVESAIRCNIYQHGELEKSYYVGGPTPDNMGTYMTLIDIETNEPSEKPFITYVPGYNSSIDHHYKTDLSAWTDKTVFNYNEADIRSIQVQNPANPEKSYELFINQGKYELKMLSNNRTISNIDTAAVDQYLTYYFQLKYENTDTTHKDLNQPPVCIITITDKGGVKNKVAFYIPLSSDVTSSSTYLTALLNNGNRVNVQLYLFGKLFQDADYFLKK